MRLGHVSVAIYGVASQVYGVSGTGLEAAQSAVAGCHDCYAGRLATIGVLVSTAQCREAVQSIFSQVMADCVQVPLVVIEGAGILAPCLRRSLTGLSTVVSRDMAMAHTLVDRKIEFARRFPQRRNASVETLGLMREYVADARLTFQNQSRFSALLLAELDRWLASPTDLHVSEAAKREHVVAATESLTRAETCIHAVTHCLVQEMLEHQWFLWVAAEAFRECRVLLLQATDIVEAASQWVLDRDFAPETHRLNQLSLDITSDGEIIQELNTLLDHQRNDFLASLLRACADGLVGPPLHAHAEELATTLMANLGARMDMIPHYRDRLTADPFAIVLPQAVVSRLDANAALRRCINHDLAQLSADLSTATPQEVAGLLLDNFSCVAELLTAARLFAAPDVGADAESAEFILTCSRMAVYPLQAVRALHTARAEFAAFGMPIADERAARRMVGDLARQVLTLPMARELFGAELTRWERDPFSLRRSRSHNSAAPGPAEVLQPSLHEPALSQSLDEYLLQFSDEDVELLCDDVEHLYSLIHRALTPDTGQSPLAHWQRVHGPRLLALAAVRDNPCQKEMLRGALMLATNIPDPGSASGLRDFCNQNAIAILAILEADEPWQLLSTGPWKWTGVGAEIAGTVNGFAVDLPRFCPDLLTSTRSKAAVLHQYVFTRRLAQQLVQRHIDVERSRIFETSLEFLNGDSASLLAGLPHVRFAGEQGTDVGGLGRDWFATIVTAVFEGPESLFTHPPGTSHAMLNPCTSFDPDRYVAAGRLLAYIIASRLPASIPLPVPFFAKLLGVQITPAVLCMESEIECNSLRAIESGDAFTIRLIMNLDEDDAVPSVEAYIESRITYYVAPHTDHLMNAIRAGFNDLLPINYVSAFLTPKDVRDLTSVDEEIDAEDIIRHTQIRAPLSETSREIQWLWNWLRAADQAMRRQYVQFITGLPRLPLGGAAALDRPFEIFSGGNGLGPVAHTCFYQLEVPPYDSESDLKEWFPQALSVDGFGLA